MKELKGTDLIYKTVLDLRLGHNDTYGGSPFVKDDAVIYHHCQLSDQKVANHMGLSRYILSTLIRLKVT